MPCGSGFRRDCVKKNKCFMRHINEVPGQKITVKDSTNERTKQASKSYETRSTQRSRDTATIMPTVLETYFDDLTDSDYENSSADTSFEESTSFIRMSPSKITRERKTPTKPTKPTNSAKSSIRMHNLHAVYGNKSDYIATGIKNIGNSCYMNAVLQCLKSSEQLVEVLLSKRDQVIINPTGSLVNELRFLLLVMQSGDYKSISPLDFKERLGSILPQFAGYYQEDAHEFLTGLLDTIKTEMELQTDFEMFEGTFESSITCSTCKNESKPKKEPFNNLQIAIPPHGGSSSKSRTNNMEM